MALDVSHLSDEGFWDVMDITSGPVCASHSNSRRVYPVSRNLTDEMFRAICQTGGVAGLNLYTGFLGEEPVTLEAACRHVLHWLELDGGKHIALGGDLDGCERLPEGLGGVDDYPALARPWRITACPSRCWRIFLEQWDAGDGIMLYVTTLDRTVTYTAQATLERATGPDGGLFVPMTLPQYDRKGLAALVALPFGSVWLKFSISSSRCACGGVTSRSRRGVPGASVYSI